MNEHKPQLLCKKKKFVGIYLMKFPNPFKVDFPIDNN